MRASSLIARALLVGMVCLVERAGAEEPAAPREMPAVVVVGATPVLGSGVDADEVPSDVQRVDGKTVAKLRPLGLGEALNARVGGVVVNDVQNNPLQPDVSFRGFTASPLLGVPQGLSVYQNGVRVNEPFGDTVQWDLVPEFALDEVDVLPGANPVYGLNSLGGALALRMKDGFRYHGAHVLFEGGSFGRVRTLLESGGQRGDSAIYGAAEGMGEHGFRDESHWAARRLYLDARHRGDSHEIGVSLTAANDELRGNGPAPIGLLAERRASIYTYPDITDNRMVLLSLEGDSELSESVSLQGTAYVRRSVRSTLNADEAEFLPCAATPAVLCDDRGAPLLSTSGSPIPRSAGGSGAINTTRTASTSLGGSLQATWTAPVGSRDNHLAAGASLDVAPVTFSRDAEIGALTADRTIRGSGFRAAGELFQTDLGVRQTALGLYATDAFPLGERVTLTASGRMNAVSMVLDDRAGASLDGSHGFFRVNPGGGVTYRVHPQATVYASYGESNRAPTPAELACADPGAPCRVPNAFLSDPPLRQVVSRSLELGARGRGTALGAARYEWSLSAFGSRNTDDILFVAGSHVGTGFFQNAGTTQRLGVEAGGSGRMGRVRVYLRYQLLRATFETPLTLPSPNHPDAVLDAGGVRVISVEPGKTMPGIPAHTAKVGFTVEPVDGWTLGASVIGSSSSYYRGDEINRLAQVPGYVVVDADSSYRLFRSTSLFLKAKNLLSTEYETFGVLGDARGVFPTARDPRFLSPGAPLGIWAGVDVGLD